MSLCSNLTLQSFNVLFYVDALIPLKIPHIYETDGRGEGEVFIQLSFLVGGGPSHTVLLLSEQRGG